MTDLWQLTVRSKADVEGFVLGEEGPLREAMESWEADPDGDITGNKVFTVTGASNTFRRQPHTLAMRRDEIKAMSLGRAE
jgi:hypothetical protein